MASDFSCCADVNFEVFSAILIYGGFMLKEDGMKICPNCLSNESYYVSEYRYNIDFDRNFLGCESLFHCSECGLLFAGPMPTVKDLNAYYKTVYRSEGRPHWHNPRLAPRPGEKHFSYLSTITHFIPLESLGTVFEIGPGAGEIGVLLKIACPEIQLYCSELDQYSQKSLSERGYVNIENIDGIQNKIDLAISIHSLEHFSEIDSFFNMVDYVIKPGGVVFTEVPNCSWGDGYSNRPYDSPHLLFFDKDSIADVFRRRGYEIISLTTVGCDFQSGFEGARKWRQQFGAWSPQNPYPNKFGYFKSKINQILPKNFIKLIKSIMAMTSFKEARLEDGGKELFNFIHNNPKSWNLRVLARKIAD